VGNATNVISKQRQGLVELFTDYGARIRIVYLEVPNDRAWQQNQDQQWVVPAAVIDRFRRRMEIPNCTEAHSLDWIVSP
jgi:predicted kinase